MENNIIERLAKRLCYIPFAVLFAQKAKFIRNRYGTTQRYSPNVKIYIENNKYIIKTVENSQELECVLKLRHDVFYKEMLNTLKSNRIDLDKFDPLCDHLAVVDKLTGSYIGTYRLNSSLFNRRFYSSTEFNIKNILSLEGNKLEVGRACVHKDYRDGILIALLWKGLSEYIKRTNTRYIFGCSSIKATDINEIIPVYLYLRKNYFPGNNQKVYPKINFRIKKFNKYVRHYIRTNNKEYDFSSKYMSSLLKAYLRIGAVICGEPVIDWQFKCTDFFTLLDMQHLNRKVEKRFITE